MIDTNLKQQVRDAQFNNAVKAARQRKFVAGCAQSGRIYSRAQHQPRPVRPLSQRRSVALQLLAIALGMVIVGAIAALVLIAFGAL